MLFAQLRHICSLESVAAASPIEHTVSARDTRATPFDGYATGDGNNNYVQGEQFRNTNTSNEKNQNHVCHVYFTLYVCAQGVVLDGSNIIVIVMRHQIDGVLLDRYFENDNKHTVVNNNNYVAPWWFARDRQGLYIRVYGFEIYNDKCNVPTMYSVTST